MTPANALPSEPALLDEPSEATEASEASVVASSATTKPLLRGVFHQISFFVALGAGVLLTRAATSRAGFLSAIVFSCALCTLFGVSALYHRIDWSTAARARMRRLDHAAIFVLIAGGYTPLFWLYPSASHGHAALVAIWVGAAVGVAKSVAWAHAPKWLTALIALALGWMVVWPVVSRVAMVGSTCIGFLVASGVTFSVGAVVYAVKKPNPWPRVFGYHEIFHLLVCGASVFLWIHALLVLRH